MVYIMAAPHNSLVLFLSEKDHRPFSDTYVFYDYVTGLFGIRGKSFNKKHVKNVFAFDCGDQKSVLTFLKEVHMDYRSLSVCLLNYVDMPLDTAEITYEYLQEQNAREMEVAGFDYKNNRYNLNNLNRLLTLLRSMYTPY